MKKTRLWLSCIALSTVIYAAQGESNPITESNPPSTPLADTIPSANKDSSTTPTSVTAPQATPDSSPATTPGNSNGTTPEAAPKTNPGIAPGTPPVTTPGTPPGTTLTPTPGATPGVAPQVAPNNLQPAPNATPSSSTTQPVEQPLCDTPANLDGASIQSWGEKVALLIFSFDSGKINEQLERLKVCFSDNGWTEFNNALTKSGNLVAIRNLKLTVSSSLDPQKNQVYQPQRTDSIWKVTVPILVVYQNDVNKISQSLNVNLTINQTTTNGPLKIEQVLASLKVNNVNTTEDKKSDSTESSAPISSNSTAP